MNGSRRGGPRYKGENLYSGMNGKNVRLIIATKGRQKINGARDTGDSENCGSESI